MANIIGLNQSQPITVQCTAAVANSAAINTQYTSNMYAYGVQNSSVTTLVIPSREFWHLVGYYVQASQSVDYMIGFTADGVPQPLQVEANASIVTNSARFVLPAPLTFPPNTSVQTIITMLAAVASNGAFTATFYLSLVRQPVGR